MRKNSTEGIYAVNSLTKQMLTLPEDAEADKIEAKVEHGVLNVHIPKKEKEDVQKAVKQIEIQ